MIPTPANSRAWRPSGSGRRSPPSKAHQRARASAAAIATEVDRIRDGLLGSWDGERGAARAAAKVVLDGSGRLGLRRGAVARAGERLADWADRLRAHVPSLPSDAKELGRLAGP